MIEWKQGEGAGLSLKIELSEEDKAARDKALYYLQFSGKTESELRKKLAEQGFLPASVDKVVEFLKYYRYLNDEDYVRRYIEKNRYKKSKKQMTCELRLKGIAEEALELVFEELPVDETAQIMAILAKKGYAGETAGRAEKMKMSAFLARKGFSYESISTALACWEETADERN